MKQDDLGALQRAINRLEKEAEEMTGERHISFVVGQHPIEESRALHRIMQYLKKSQPVPEGYALVPVEPTREMLVDGAKTARDFLWEAGPYPRSRAVYRAMLAAAPKPGADDAQA